MELHNALALETDLQTETTLFIDTDICSPLENTITKQKPDFHTIADSAKLSENTKYAVDVTNVVDIKTEVIDNGHYGYTYTQRDRGISSSSNYVNICIPHDAHMAQVKSEPTDHEPEETTDHTKFIIEIDTCKDEYYETHGYPSSHAIVHLGNSGVGQGSGGDCAIKEDTYLEHVDTQQKGWAAPPTSIDTPPCTVVLHDIGYSYPDMLTQGYVHVYEQEPTIQIRVQQSTYVHASPQSKHKPYCCSVCGVGYTLKRNMKTHMRIHTNENLHICSVCEVRFTQKDHLASHMRIHTGEKPYKCSVCGVGFAHATGLKYHTTTHTGEKSHTCTVCGVGFSQKSNLTTHTRIHTWEKPHKCTVCGVGFSRKSSMETHMRIHTGEKPHKCSVCEVSFTERGHLTRHMRTHTGEKPYKCPVCGIRLGHANTLKKHMARHDRSHTEFSL